MEKDEFLGKIRPGPRRSARRRFCASRARTGVRPLAKACWVSKVFDRALTFDQERHTVDETESKTQERFSHAHSWLFFSSLRRWSRAFFDERKRKHFQRDSFPPVRCLVRVGRAHGARDGARLAAAGVHAVARASPPHAPGPRALRRLFSSKTAASKRIGRYICKFVDFSPNWKDFLNRTI